MGELAWMSGRNGGEWDRGCEWRAGVGIREDEGAMDFRVLGLPGMGSMSLTFRFHEASIWLQFISLPVLFDCPDSDSLSGNVVESVQIHAFERPMALLGRMNGYHVAPQGASKPSTHGRFRNNSLSPTDEMPISFSTSPTA